MGTSPARASIYPVHHKHSCSMGSEPGSERQIHMGWVPGTVTCCGPLWKQSNALVIQGTKKNKAGGRGSLESDRVVLLDVEVSMSFSDELIVESIQEGTAWVGARGEGSNQRGSMCKSPGWEPQRGQYGWRECQWESVGVVGDTARTKSQRPFAGCTKENIYSAV